MSYIGSPGPIGLSGKDDDKYTPYDLGWNTAFEDFHPTKLTLKNLESRGWIDGYLAYIREYFNTEKTELNPLFSRRGVEC